jgi:hypothetical protein
VAFLGAILPSSIFVDLQLETPDLPQETPDVRQETQDNLQETQDDLQETQDDLTDLEMGEFTWEDLELLETDKKAHEELINIFCKPSRASEPMQPTLPILLNLIQKYMLKAGTLIIKKMEKGIPVYERGREGNVVQPETPDLRQETPDVR